MVRHILKRGPRHDLEKITIERSVEAVRGSSSGTVGVEMIEVFAGPHDFIKFSKGGTPFPPAGFVRCQVAGNDVRTMWPQGAETKHTAQIDIGVALLRGCKE